MGKAEVFKMPSGAELHVGMAEFAQSHALMQSVLKQMAGLKLNPADLQLDMNRLQENPAAIMVLLDKVITVATSDDVTKAAFACASSAKYAPRANAGLVSVDAALFDDEAFGMQAREDYYTILYRIAEVNCKPFFVKTLSELLRRKNQTSPVPA